MEGQMADPVYINNYRQEHIAVFEQNYSILRVGCVQESVVKGNTAIFLVSGSGGATAVTRGVNGLIPYSTTDNTQYTCTLVERHAPFERTAFNIFASQGDQKRTMQEGSVAVLNRDIDQTIIDELDTATVTTGNSVTASLDLVMKAIVKLGNAEVDVQEEDKMFALITPAFRAYLMQVTEFSSGDYVDVKPFTGPARRMWRWNGINWMVHPNLTGNGTSTEKCYMWHQNSLGHGANGKDMDVQVGYDGKQDLSWSRATLYHGAKILQNSGIVQMKHDGSAYA
jgi:hypothetical protein